MQICKTDTHVLTDTAFWRDVQHIDSPLPSTEDGNMQIAMSNTSVHLARKFYAEVFNLTLDQVPLPNSAVSKMVNNMYNVSNKREVV